MTDRLRRALEHIDELPETLQDDLAQQIEELIDPDIDYPPLPGSPIGDQDDATIDFDQMLADLDHIRHGNRAGSPMKEPA